MNALDNYPLLNAALEDMLLVTELAARGKGSPRHIVSLLHDAVEFILYESLSVLGHDIYRNGQNTIGLNEAMALCKTSGIDLPLLGTIRAIQKHRGDAKHHGQTPHEAAVARMMGGFRIVASRLVHERFGEALGDELRTLGLLPYHVALYESYRKYRTHDWELALRFALGALLHKHRALLGTPEDDYSSGIANEPARTMEALKTEIASAPYPVARADVLDELKRLPLQLTALMKENKVREAAEAAARGYARVDAVVPSIFDIKTARPITDRLVQPEHLTITRSMSWSKWVRADTKKKGDIEARLLTLLKQRPDVVQAFGRPYYEEDDDRYWRWWEFAVFDGTEWHTFHLDDHFDLFLESGSLSDEDGVRRERVAELILCEFERAPHLRAAQR